MLKYWKSVSNSRISFGLNPYSFSLLDLYSYLSNRSSPDLLHRGFEQFLFIRKTSTYLLLQFQMFWVGCKKKLGQTGSEIVWKSTKLPGSATHVGWYKFWPNFLWRWKYSSIRQHLKQVHGTNIQVMREREKKEKERKKKEEVIIILNWSRLEPMTNGTNSPGMQYHTPNPNPHL